MDNPTIITICSYFAIVFAVFWASSSLLNKTHTKVSYIWCFGNIALFFGFYSFQFMDKNIYYTFYYSDMSFIICLFFIQFGLFEFLKKQIDLQFYIFIFASAMQLILRFIHQNYFAVFNISFYMMYINASLIFKIFTNLQIKEKKTKLIIVFPIFLSFLFMFFRVVGITLRPNIYNFNLLNNTPFNSFIDLGLLLVVFLINLTVCGVLVSDLIVKINHLANIDTLTKAFNRRYLHQLVDSLHTKKTAYSVVALDIDFFKYINDTFGHDVGDCFLVEFSELVVSIISDYPDSCFFRLGGEEFCIVLPSTNQLYIKKLSDEIHEKMKNKQWTSGINHHPTVSIGVSVQETITPLKEMLKQSDLALYKAKQNGRNQTFFAF